MNFTLALFLLTACALDSSPEAPAEAAPTAEAPPATATADEPPGFTPSGEWVQMPLPDTILIPGERFGPLTATSTRQDVVQIFTGAILLDRRVDLGEGFTAAGLVVSLASGSALEIVWTDDSASGIDEVRTQSDLWRTPEGLHVGMDLSALRAIIDPFSVHGFGWDHGGTIRFDDSPVTSYAGLLFLALAPSEAGRQTAAWSRMKGDRLFPSTHPDLAMLEPTVASLRVKLSP